MLSPAAGATTRIAVTSSKGRRPVAGAGTHTATRFLLIRHTTAQHLGRSGQDTSLRVC